LFVVDDVTATHLPFVIECFGATTIYVGILVEDDSVTAEFRVHVSRVFAAAEAWFSTAVRDSVTTPEVQHGDALTTAI